MDEKNTAIIFNGNLVPAGKTLIVFDGACHLCSGFAGFLLRHNRKKMFLFATLQSIEKISPAEEIKNEILQTDSVAVISDGKIYFRSDALLKLFQQLGGGWKIFVGLRIIPKPILDWMYKMIAGNRYKWFGKKDSCILPDDEVKGIFLIKG
jgi:predicted DCC family thiol-disulfide oxidoreductase YuxK